MRLDKYLKVSRLIKRRTLAKEACNKGKIKVNNKTAKAGQDVSVDDIIEMDISKNPIKVRILKTKEHVRKQEAKDMYEIL